MIVFMGSGRSGTGLYSKLFDTHHEYKVRRMVRQWRTLPGFRNPPTDLLADIEVRRRMMRSHLKTVDLTTFRDSGNPYIHFPDVLFEIDPKVRIVLGVRDGRDFARSGITGGFHLPDGYFRLRGMNAVIRATWRTAFQMCGHPLPGRFTGFGQQPEQDDPWFAEWPQMSPVERMAWLWQYRNEKALTRLQSVPRNQWTMVRLEDLTRDPVRGRLELRRLEEFLGIDGHPEWLSKKYNASQKKGFPDKGNWTEATVRSFYRIAGPTMEKLGYGSMASAACA